VSLEAAQVTIIFSFKLKNKHLQAHQTTVFTEGRLSLLAIPEVLFVKFCATNVIQLKAQIEMAK